MKIPFKRVAALMLLVSYSAFAVELDPIIVTATGTAQTVDESLASTTVITRADIERRQAVSLPEMLRGVPGLALTNNGGLGKTTSVFLRGTESDHVLVLIDGIRVGSVTLGTTAFQDLPIDQIERIEIVRGPRASLYGSDAIGGVIQIFTRKGTDELKPSFAVSGGTHDTYKVSGALSGGYDAGWFNLSVSHLDTEGFNACQGAPFPPGGGCFTFEPDDDGFRSTSGSARLGYRFDNGLEVEANFLHAEGHNEFDGTVFSGNEGDFLQQVLGGSVRYSPLSFWDTTVKAGRSRDESKIFFNGADVDTFDSERIQVTWQNDFSLYSDHLLTTGLDFYEDSVESTQAFAVDSRYNIAGFGQYQGRFENIDWIFGTRYDENEQFGGQVTGNVAMGYLLENGIRLSASWGSAFKAPTFNELYFPGFGNPQLDPEESWSAEVGIAGKHAGINWSINSYYTEIDELITFDSVTFSPMNIGKALIYGVELSASVRIIGWDIATNFSYIDHENREDGANKGNLLPRRPNETFQLDVDRSFGRFTVGTTVYAAGRRFDDIANNQRLGGFVIVDLRANVEVIADLFIEGRVTNLLNKEYETANMFNQDGSNFMIGLRYSP